MTNAQSGPLSVQTLPNNYRPSVPMSVYRELAAELEKTKFQLETLNTQNQLLVAQNQELRAEIIKVIETHLHLEEVVNSLPSVSATISHQPQPNPTSVQIQPLVLENRPEPVSVSPQPELELETPPENIPDKIVIEESVNPPSPSSVSPKSGFTGWILMAMMMLIVSTAFVGSFLIVYPILNNSGEKTIKMPESPK